MRTLTPLLIILLLLSLTLQSNKIRSRKRSKKSNSQLKRSTKVTSSEKSLKNGQTIEKNVKCLFTDEYSIYDLRPLAKDKKDGDGNDYKVNVDGHEVTFNFCQNLNKETCPNLDKTSVALFGNQCIALAGDYENGSEWKVKKFSNDTKGTTITMTLPKANGQNKDVVFELECENNKDKYKNNKFVLTSSNYGNDEVSLHFTTYYACPVINFYRIWKFISDNYIVFAVILIVVGLTVTFVGNKFLTVTVFIVVIISFVIIIDGIIFTYIIPETVKNWVIWMILAITAVVGAVVAFFVAKYKDKVLGIIFGFICGFYLGQFIFSLVANIVSWHPLIVHILIVVVCIIIMCVLGYFFMTYFIIISTSIIGAYLSIRGVSVLCGHFPNLSTIMDLASSGEKEQLKKLFTWRVYLYLASMVILAVLGVFVQILLKKREDAVKKNKGPGYDDDEKQNLLK